MIYIYILYIYISWNIHDSLFLCRVTNYKIMTNKTIILRAKPSLNLLGYIAIILHDFMFITCTYISSFFIYFHLIEKSWVWNFCTNLDIYKFVSFLVFSITFKFEIKIEIEEERKKIERKEKKLLYKRRLFAYGGSVRSPPPPFQVLQIVACQWFSNDDDVFVFGQWPQFEFSFCFVYLFTSKFFNQSTFYFHMSEMSMHYF